jgi:hypothetical protein
VCRRRTGSSDSVAESRNFTDPPVAVAVAVAVTFSLLVAESRI